MRSQEGQHNQAGQRDPVRPGHGLERVLCADCGLQIDYVIGGAGLMVVAMIEGVVMIEVVLMIEVVAVPRMHIRAEIGGGTDVRMRRIERHQQNAEVQ